MFFYKSIVASALCSYLTEAQSTRLQPWIPVPTSIYNFKGPGTAHKHHDSLDLSVVSNPENVRVFIAIALRNAEDIVRGGVWSEALLSLINLLGPENTFLSIFENDSTDGTAKALQELNDRVRCPSSVVSKSIPGVFAHDGGAFNTKPLRRIRHMADIRNRVLHPLFEHKNSQFPNDPSVSKPYDRILWLNDVIFNSYDLLTLILDTNNGEYSAACALDYINPVTMYDYFALRDVNGKAPATTTYPFFEPGVSRQQLLDGKRDIQVSSCWGGAASFDARPFYKDPTLRFRDSGSDTWEASECCLIHSDLGKPEKTFVNSAVRVAYDEWSFSWLAFASRYEHWMFKAGLWLSWILSSPFTFSKVGESSINAGVLGTLKPMAISNGESNFCSWPFMMYMGQYDPHYAYEVPGHYVHEHQDGVNSSYWVATL